jgi:hypothetical protein
MASRRTRPTTDSEGTCISSRPAPEPLFATPLPFNPGPNGVNVPYDVTADGQRLLLSLPVETPERDVPLTVVTNWRAAWTR